MLVRNILLTLGGLSLFAGLLLTVVWFRQVEKAPPSPIPVAKSEIMVASHAVQAGTLLRPEDIAWRDITASNIQTGFIVRRHGTAAEFVGAITRRGLAADEPFLVTELVRPSERQFLAAVLKPGSRAVSIAVDAPQSAAGLILPGDQVDVILAQSFTEGTVDPGRRSVAETVLRDVRVIAMDQSLGAPTRETAPRAPALGESRAPRTVTFEVTEKQAERLVVASQLGRLQLAVRPLQSAPTGAPAPPPPQAGPTWADEVSPALSTISRATPPAATAGIESTIRLPPRQGDGP